MNVKATFFERAGDDSDAARVELEGAHPRNRLALMLTSLVMHLFAKVSQSGFAVGSDGATLSFGTQPRWGCRGH